jgi:hypothetical protein
VTIEGILLEGEAAYRANWDDQTFAIEGEEDDDD